MMSSQNTVNGPDEDEHYEIRELGHPNKAFRMSHGNVENQTSMAMKIGAMLPSSVLGSGHSAELLAAANGDKGGTSAARGTSHSQQIPAHLAALTCGPTAAATTSGSAVTRAEQVRMAKVQAIEILHVLEKESLLEWPVGQYVEDVEASYNEGDPKLTFPKLRAAWTPEEDRLLMVGVRVYGPNTESWPRIAMLVPGRTNKSCRKRWFHSLDPSLHKGPWTPAEDDLLRQRVAQYPSQWSRVAEGITGRTDDQCAKRWRESLDPEIDRGKWRPEEDRLLLEKYAELGTQWQKIATFFQGRPGLHCRNRWRKIQRIILQKEKKSGPIAPTDLTRTLASVTESVNRRKTAQRSRPQNKGSSTSVAALSGPAHTERLSDAPDPQLVTTVAEQPSQSSDFQYANSTDATTKYAQDHQQQQFFRTSSMATSFVGGSSADLAYAEDTGGTTPYSSFLHTQQHSAVSTPVIMSSQQHYQQYYQQQRGSPETMGALYMPSTEQQTSAPTASSPADGALQASFRQATSGGAAKRSSSVLFSPTDEQRQRLRTLGRKLYGCSAETGRCSAAFADAMSLNSHLKFSHPSVAAQIPSLSTGMSATDMTLADAETAAQGFGRKNQLKPYRCAMTGCDHSYKNVNGLEYHIFHSRKANVHLMADGSIKGESPDMAGDGSAAHESAGDSGELGGSLADPGGGLLQCAEVDCLAQFEVEQQLREHMARHHPRPIRRAKKRGDARVAAHAGSHTPLEAPATGDQSFWGASLGSVLGTTALDATSEDRGEQRGYSEDVDNAAAAAAIAAAIGYGTEQSSAFALAPEVHSHVQQLLSPHMPPPSLPSHAFLQGPSAPFFSAPALVSATGGEHAASSYFALGQSVRDARHPQQLDAFTPMLLGSGSVAQASGSEFAGERATSHTQSTDEFQLNMEFMQSMFSPFCAPTTQLCADGDGDVHMRDDLIADSTRAQRSGSVDLTLATVPSRSATIIESPLMAPTNAVPPNATSRSGSHSQMATALLARRREQSTAVRPGSLALPSWSHNTVTSQQQQQELSALGLLSAPVGAESNRHSMFELPRVTTPQPTDLAQFQSQDVSQQLPRSATSLISCPIFTCAMRFSDANALKHHLNYDHPREETIAAAASYSNPGSPIVEGMLSTRSFHNLPTAPISANMLSQQYRMFGAPTINGERAKAPHWVDPSLWSMWIAAANGNGNITNAATATAMGITPGVSGTPQSFLQLSTTDQIFTAENDLLRMFESAAAKDSTINQTSTS
ncbi:hypothetical protein H4S08_004677 [Coemansia sp. RSA 1365]|nr:hypothetical protein H4S08_004677 [Coemansia sp. RSA 1365]